MKSVHSIVLERPIFNRTGIEPVGLMDINPMDAD